MTIVWAEVQGALLPTLRAQVGLTLQLHHHIGAVEDLDDQAIVRVWRTAGRGRAPPIGHLTHVEHLGNADAVLNELPCCAGLIADLGCVTAAVGIAGA